MNDDNVAAEAHIEMLIARLSLSEKVRLLSGAGYWSTQAEPAIGLKRMVLSDGPVGVRGEKSWSEHHPSASLPSPSAIAATWDEQLVDRLARFLATEARRKGVHVVLGPTINLHRSPLGGRHFECFSEDPLLTSRLAVAYVRALQAAGIGAAPKHYVANDSETDRFAVDIRVNERVLRELYLAPFEHVVAAGAWLLMAAYNTVNGRTMTEHPLLSEPLKGEWGFAGVVVSDWTAVRSTEAAGLAGTDLAMPGPSDVWGEPLIAAVQDGRVPESAVDDKVRRILRLASRVGALDSDDSPAVLSMESTNGKTLLRETAARGMVLLRNDDLLPLDAWRCQRIAVIGLNAVEPQIQGGGSVCVVPPYVVSPLEGIRATLGDDVNLTYHLGVDSREDLPPAPVELLLNTYTNMPGVHVRFLDAGGRELRVEERRATRLTWSRDDIAGVETIEVSARLRARIDGVHVLGVSGMVEGRGTYRLECAETVLVDEVISWDEELGIVSLNRKGELKFSKGEENDVVLSYQLGPGELGASLTFGLREPTTSAAETLAEAVAAAKAADVAIVVVGTNSRHEGEGFDRRSLALPGEQDHLVQAVAAANARTVVVVNSGSPVEMPWHTEVPAILLSWFPGQEFGNALADVLFGLNEPGGRLPTTWSALEDDVPVLDTQPRDGRLSYAEGLHIGYRAWARAGKQPAYPFGHGLGYTTWKYRSVYAPRLLRFGQSATIHVAVANSGERTGREVIQVYLQRLESTIERPVLWLAGFVQITAEPGEEVEAVVDIPARAFRHWSTTSRCWETEPGAYSVLVGRSSADLPLRTIVTITRDTDDPA